MATYNSLSDLFEAIADAIRAKRGTNASIVATDFPDEIDAISTSGGGSSSITSGSLTIRCVATNGNTGSASVAVAYPAVEDGDFKMKVNILNVGGSMTIPMPYFPDYTGSNGARPRLAIIVTIRSSGWYLDYSYGGTLGYLDGSVSYVPSLYVNNGDSMTTGIMFTKLPTTDEPYNEIITIPIRR